MARPSPAGLSCPGAITTGGAVASTTAAADASKKAMTSTTSTAARVQTRAMAGATHPVRGAHNHPTAARNKRRFRCRFRLCIVHFVVCRTSYRTSPSRSTRPSMGRITRWGILLWVGFSHAAGRPAGRMRQVDYLLQSGPQPPAFGPRLTRRVDEEIGVRRAAR